MEIIPNPQRSMLKSVFLSSDEPRLRAGWRLVIQTILLVFFASCAITPILFFPSIPSKLVVLYYQFVMVFSTTLSIFLVRRFLDKRSFGSLGLKLDLRALLDLFAGIVITFFIMGLIFAIEWAAGWLTIERFAWEVDPIGTVLIETFLVWITFVLVGWNEELLSRGYHLQTLESGLNTFWAVLLSSAVFGIMHLGNPNSESAWFVFIGILLAGIFLAFGYLRTRQLWLPIGLHIGWNFFEGVVFGFPVSGTDNYHLLRISVDGPELWTGGPFGPEAGLVLIPALIVGALLIFVYTRQRLKTGEDEDTREPVELTLP